MAQPDENGVNGLMARSSAALAKKLQQKQKHIDEADIKRQSAHQCGTAQNHRALASHRAELQIDVFEILSFKGRDASKNQNAHRRNRKMEHGALQKHIDDHRNQQADHRNQEEGLKRAEIALGRVAIYRAG